MPLLQNLSEMKSGKRNANSCRDSYPKQQEGHTAGKKGGREICTPGGKEEAGTAGSPPIAAAAYPYPSRMATEGLPDIKRNNR